MEGQQSLDLSGYGAGTAEKNVAGTRCARHGANAARPGAQRYAAAVAAGEIESVFAALEASGSRYLVVGGVAVVLHGHLRFTADVDLVIALAPDNLRAALAALEGLGYRPRAPVSLAELLDPAQRRRWIDEKGLTVLSLWSPRMPATEVDVFVQEPFPFDAAYARALRVELGPTRVTVAAIRDLVALKRAAGRPQDLEDVRALLAIARELGEEVGGDD